MSAPFSKTINHPQPNNDPEVAEGRQLRPVHPVSILTQRLRHVPYLPQRPAGSQNVKVTAGPGKQSLVIQGYLRGLWLLFNEC